MAKVIQLQKKSARPEVVERFSRQLAQARMGRITGLMYVVARSDGTTQSGFCGDFKDDMEYATAAASESFALLVGRTTCSQNATTKKIIRPPVQHVPRAIRRA